MDDEKLIEYVRNSPCLYNKKHKDFKNRDKKRRAWMAVAANMVADVNSVMKRWQNLRERFSKELRSPKNQSGSDGSEVYQWPLLENLDFLRAHIIPRLNRQSAPLKECNLEANMSGGEILNEFWTSTTPDPISEIKQISTSQEQLNYTPPPNQYAPSTSSTRKRSYSQTRDDLGAIIHDAVKEFQEVCARKARREEISPEISGFGKMICSAISNMKRKTQAQVMRQCTEIVMEAQIEEAEEEEDEKLS